MKKTIILVVVLTFLSILSASSDIIHDISDTGWVASNGLYYLPGYANNVHLIPGGWSFCCTGPTGTCYLISGNDLWINDGPGSGGAGVDVIKMP